MVVGGDGPVPYDIEVIGESDGATKGIRALVVLAYMAWSFLLGLAFAGAIQAVWPVALGCVIMLVTSRG